jgi:hypothetical protein
MPMPNVGLDFEAVQRLQSISSQGQPVESLRQRTVNIGKDVRAEYCYRQMDEAEAGSSVSKQMRRTVWRHRKFSFVCRKVFTEA